MGFIPFSLDEVMSSVPSGFKNLFLIFHSNKKKVSVGFHFNFSFPHSLNSRSTCKFTSGSKALKFCKTAPQIPNGHDMLGNQNIL